MYTPSRKDMETLNVHIKKVTIKCKLSYTQPINQVLRYSWLYFSISN